MMQYRYVLAIACFVLAVAAGEVARAASEPAVSFDQLTGEAEAPERSASEWREVYERAVAQLVPRLAADDREARYEPRMRLEDICDRAARPGAEAQRQALAEVIAEAAADASTPLPARRWLTEKLRLFGQAEVMETLAALLDHEDARLADAARRALEQNPGDAAGGALRAALKEASTPAQRVALLNSLGARAGTQAVDAIADALPAEDEAVAAAAVEALGRKDSVAALQSLHDVAGDAAASLEPELTTARINVAGRLLASGGDKGRALARQTLETARDEGAKAHRQAALFQLLVHEPAANRRWFGRALSGDDAALQAPALRAARAVAGEEVTRVLAGVVNRAEPTLQARILDVLAARADPAAEDVVARTLQSSDVEAVRLAAVKALAAIATEGAAEKLLELAGSGNGAVPQRAAEALSRMGGKSIDRLMLARARQGRAEIREAAVRAVTARRTAGAVAELLVLTGAEPDAVRRAAFEGLGAMAQPRHLGPMLSLLLREADERHQLVLLGAIKRVLSRVDKPGQHASLLLDAYDRASEGWARLALLELLGQTSSRDALAKVNEVATEGEGELREQALSVLMDWPNFDAAGPLLAIARELEPGDGRAEVLEALAQQVHDASDQPAAGRLNLLASGLALVEPSRVPSTRLAWALGGIHTREALAVAAGLFEDEIAQESAASAIATIAQHLPERSERAERVLERIANAEHLTEPNRKRAAEVLEEVRGRAPEPTKAKEARTAPAEADVLLPQKPGEPPNLAAWENQQWLTLRDGSMVVAPETDSNATKQKYRDFELYLEFMIPHEPLAAQPGNSGVILRGEHELQILDTTGIDALTAGDGGGVYGVAPPRVDASKGPLRWQRYRIRFRAPRFDGGEVTQSARLTVRHNGELIHDELKLPAPSGDGRQAEPMPIVLQAHGHPTRFRHIWVRPLE